MKRKNRIIRLVPHSWQREYLASLLQPDEKKMAANNFLYVFRGIQIGISEIMLILLFLFVVFLIIRNIALPARP